MRNHVRKGREARDRRYTDAVTRQTAMYRGSLENPRIVAAEAGYDEPARRGIGVTRPSASPEGGDV